MSSSEADPEISDEFPDAHDTDDSSDSGGFRAPGGAAAAPDEQWTEPGYGSLDDDLDRRRPPRWRRWALVVSAVVAGAAATYFGYTSLATTPIEGQRVAFSEQPGNAMEITIDVLREDVSRPGVCVVRVRDRSGAESGRREVYVPSGKERLTTVVHSIGTPVTADIIGCTYTVPEYMSTSERPTG